MTGANLTITVQGGTMPTCGSLEDSVYVRTSFGGKIFCTDPIPLRGGQFLYDPEGVANHAMTTPVNLEKVWGSPIEIALLAINEETDRETTLGGYKVVLGDFGMDRNDFRRLVLAVEDRDSQDDKTFPEVRMAVHLTSPFREPLETVVEFLGAYTSTVDTAVDTVCHQAGKMMPFLTSKKALAPARPLRLMALSSLPLLLTIGLVGFPLLLPAFLALAAVALVAGLLGGLVYLSSRWGRGKLWIALEPVLVKLQENPQIIYPLGPRPTINQVAKAVAPRDPRAKLILSFLIDAIGASSYLLPGIGEAGDLMWAPMSGIMINAMYYESSPWAGWLGAVEEFLPFTDIIPTASLAWLKEYGPTIVTEVQRMVLRRR